MTNASAKFLNPYRPRPWPRGRWHTGSWQVFARQLGIGAITAKRWAASLDWPAHIPRVPPWTPAEAAELAREWMRLRRRLPA